jgi:hypothetical protein
VAYEWGRFVWWLGQNAAAIQAFASLITVILTFVLVRITAEYVRLNARMSRSAEAQLVAQYMSSMMLGDVVSMYSMGMG